MDARCNVVQELIVVWDDNIREESSGAGADSFVFTFVLDLSEIDKGIDVSSILDRL